jgi:hypothetical protein
MQVFVPFPQYSVSLGLLDSSRLNKQALECTQLLDIMLGIPTKTGKVRTGWLNHVALVAWKQNPGALIKYLKINATMLKTIGYKTDYCDEKLLKYESFNLPDDDPIWLGDELIHSSHRARLLQKGFEQKLKGQKNADNIIELYKSFNWEEMHDPILFRREYKWPVNITTTSYQLEERVSKPAMKVKDELVKTYGVNPYL